MVNNPNIANAGRSGDRALAPIGQGNKVIEACGGRYLTAGWIRNNDPAIPGDDWKILPGEE